MYKLYVLQMYLSIQSGLFFFFTYFFLIIQSEIIIGVFSVSIEVKVEIVKRKPILEVQF